MEWNINWKRSVFDFNTWLNSSNTFFFNCFSIWWIFICFVCIFKWIQISNTFYRIPFELESIMFCWEDTLELSENHFHIETLLFIKVIFELFLFFSFLSGKQIKRKIINKIIQLTLCLFFISLFFLFTVVQFDWMFLLILNMFNCFGVFILFFSMKMLCCFESNIFIDLYVYCYISLK